MREKLIFIDIINENRPLLFFYRLGIESKWKVTRSGMHFNSSIPNAVKVSSDVSVPKANIVSRINLKSGHIIYFLNQLLEFH